MKPLLACLSFLLLPFPAVANDSPEALQRAFMDALQANDAAALAACYSEDAVNFPVASMRGVGPDSVRRDWEAFFSAWRVVGAELSEQHLETHGDTAVAWGLFSIMAEPAAGGTVVRMDGRYMDVARLIDGQWLYVADHASMPLPAGGDANGAGEAAH